MLTYHPIRLATLALSLLAGLAFWQPASAQDKVILVQIDPTVEVDDDDLYDDTNEAGRYNMAAAEAGPLMTPTLLPAGQSAYRAADCFIPDYKLIYKDFTYVVSTFCTQAMKFRNSAPYTPSAVEVHSDFVFCNKLLDIIEKTAKAKFTKDFTATFQELQTAEENFAGRSQSESSNTPSETEARSIIEGASDFNNPQQEVEEERDRVDTQVNTELQNVREEEITNPVTPDDEADDQPALNGADQRVDDDLNREQQNNGTSRPGQ